MAASRPPPARPGRLTTSRRLPVRLATPPVGRQAAVRRPVPTALAPSPSSSPTPPACGRRRRPPALAATAATPADAARPHVIVLGGGVIGWSTALAIASLPSAPATTLVAASFDDTTSHGAGGLWEPYKCGATPPSLINAWGGATLAHLRALHASPAAGEAGVTEHAVFQLWTAAGPSPAPPDPAWAGVVPHFRRLGRAELDAWEAASAHTPGPRAAYASGWTFWTATAQPTRYLPWLAAKARAAGVRTHTARVARLADLATLLPAAPAPAALVNCAGLGAREAAPDPTLVPVRGQVARLGAPWVKAAVFVDEDTYVIPNVDFTVVGGTAQAGDSDATPRPGDRADILARAARAVPALVGAPGLGDWAGLRPVRPTVRVEAEEEGGVVGGGSGPAIVHNYGHGGSGVTLHWGCAAAAAGLVEAALARRGVGLGGKER